MVSATYNPHYTCGTQDVPGGVADQASGHSPGRCPGTGSLRPGGHGEGLGIGCGLMWVDVD